MSDSLSDDQMPGIIVSTSILSPAESIKVPGAQVEYMQYGEWTGPFSVTGNTGRTPDHLVLRNPANGVLFEVYNDFPYNLRAV